MKGERASVYVHVPFCRQLCPYCDFAVTVRRVIPHEAYAAAVVAELRARRDALRGRDVGTVYFGGGTPALLTPAALERIAAEVFEASPRAAEVTLEANPLDVTAAAVQRWRAIGFTRLSLGVQSFDADYLKRLGRDHDGSQAREAVELALGADMIVSMDLIYGGPHHDGAILERDLALVEALGPHHVSAYQMTVEEGTVFGRRAREGTLRLPDEDGTADLSDILNERLAGLGYDRYEVSSFARDGHRSAHNSGYWTGVEYLGVGMGAHSLAIDAQIERRANTRRLSQYLAAPAGAFEVEVVDPLDHLRERLFLAMRTRVGVWTAELERQFGGLVPDLAGQLEALLAPMRAEGLLEPETGVILPTARGLDVSDRLAERVYRASFVS